jgi:hypothetical protein
MIWTIVAIWAVVIPVIVLLLTWDAARRREARAAQARRRSLPTHRQSGVPACVVRATRPSRTTTRRICPHVAGRVRRRPASA